VKKIRFSMKDVGAGVRSRDRTYGLEPGGTVQSVKGNFIFTSHPIAHVFLF
jgi:hypothetical protein